MEGVTYMKRLITFLLIAIIILAGCGQSTEKKSNKSSTQKDTLNISAAASLTDVTKELEQAFNKQHDKVAINFNYGGSGSLRQQIEKGAPSDVFMSANIKDVKILADKDKAHNTYNYAQNELVLIGNSKTDKQDLSQLQNDEKVAIGEPNSVPAGKYAQQFLKDQNLYDNVKPHLVYAKDVRQVLNYVTKGNAQFGYVYQTDLAQHKKNGQTDVKELGKATLKTPITYQAATVSNKKEAKAWMKFLKTKEAKEILEKYDFKV